MMKLSEKLLLVADWLSSHENDLLVNAENDEKSLEIVANALVKAAEALEEGAVEISKVEPLVSSENLDEMAAVAASFDESGDELLQKQASVLDSILLTFAAPKGYMDEFKRDESKRIEELKKKYDLKSKFDEMNKTSEDEKLIEKSPIMKVRRILSAPLSTRYCPQHPGVPLARIAEHTGQCILDKKIYNYDIGYEVDGEKIPGGDVAEQTKMQYQPANTMFDTRNERLGLE